MEKSKAPFHIDRNGYQLRWDAIPAWVCSQCGEASFEGKEVDTNTTSYLYYGKRMCYSSINIISGKYKLNTNGFYFSSFKNDIQKRKRTKRNTSTRKHRTI